MIGYPTRSLLVGDEKAGDVAGHGLGQGFPARRVEHVHRGRQGPVGVTQPGHDDALAAGIAVPGGQVLLSGPIGRHVRPHLVVRGVGEHEQVRGRAAVGLEQPAVDVPITRGVRVVEMLPDHHVVILLVGGHGRRHLAAAAHIDVELAGGHLGAGVVQGRAPDIIASGAAVASPDCQVAIQGQVVDDVHLLGGADVGDDEVGVGHGAIRHHPLAGHVGVEEGPGIEGTPDDQVLVIDTVPGCAGGHKAPVGPGKDLERGVLGQVQIGAIPLDASAPDLVDAATDLVLPDNQVLVIGGVVGQGRPRLLAPVVTQNQLSNWPLSDTRRA